MYLYKIGYGTYEESDFWEYSHESKFSKEELGKEVEEALWDTIVSWATDKQVRDDYLFVGDQGPSFQHLLKCTTFHEHFKNRGFKAVQYEESWSCFGWPSAIDPDSWGTQRDDVEKEMCVRLSNRMSQAGIKVSVKKETSSFGDFEIHILSKDTGDPSNG